MGGLRCGFGLRDRTRHRGCRPSSLHNGMKSDYARHRKRALDQASNFASVPQRIVIGAEAVIQRPVCAQRRQMHCTCRVNFVYSTKNGKLGVPYGHKEGWA